MFLASVVLDVDGYSYDEIKGTDWFTAIVYKEDVIYTGDLFDEIGEYKIKINARDNAYNEADEKILNIIVADGVAPILEIADDVEVVEIKQGVELKGIKATDNYALEVIEGVMIKEKFIGLEGAQCMVTTSSGSTACGVNVGKVSNNTYEFKVAGLYTFVYTVTDVSMNTSTITRYITVKDNSGPNMTSFEFISREIMVGERNSDGSINVSGVVLKYPDSFDVGDDSSRTVQYVGLFSLNSMKEKYKIINDTYLVSDSGTYVTYRFNIIGTYYLRFSSSDNSGNVSIFEYEVKIIDKQAPIIEGVSNGDVIELEVGASLDVVEDVINAKGVTASDNYDNDVPITYEVLNAEEHTYEVKLKVKDSSDNVNVVTVFVDLVDNEKPIAGSIMLPPSTNLNEIQLKIAGGEDNSNNFYHEYSVQGGSWIRYSNDSSISFGDGLSKNIEVCVRAVDQAGNVSANIPCSSILVDTLKPTISGVSDGDILNRSTEINVVDARLESVKIYLNDEVILSDVAKLPLEVYEEGIYSVEAKDSLGNESVVNFVISLDTYLNIIDDIKNEEYTVTSIEFSKLRLVKLDVEYDGNGNSQIEANISNININNGDVLYILGVVPDSDEKFVMFNAAFDDMSMYGEEITLISYGDNIKIPHDNERFLVNINGDYYAYLMIREQIYKEPQVVEKETANKDNSGMVKTALIVVGAFAAFIIVRALVNLRKRVKAA